jgi:bifunctional DNA-binding transcriptional regulator/antitoxin component of YhaV-PrlF toxin-antitoxin module
MQTRAQIVRRIDPQMRLSIPIEFARRYDLDKGDYVVVQADEDCLTLKKLKLEEPVEQAVAA